MTEDLKNKLFRRENSSSETEYIDADNISVYTMISKNKNILAVVCFVLMFIETFVIGSIGYLFKHHFTYNFLGALGQGLKTIPLNYILWGVTLIMFSTLYLIRYRKNPRFDEERRYTKSNLGTYGTADWMPKDEFDTFLLETKIEKTTQPILGTRNGKVVTTNPDIHPKDQLNPHFFIVGASGSRKTRTYVFTNIFQAIRRGESVILSDPKGELYRETYTLFAKHGYNTKVLNLKEPLKSDHWAVLSEAEKGTDSAQILCDVIIKNTGGEKGDEFFNNAELNLLKAIVLFVASSSWHKEHNLDNIRGVYDLILTCNDAELMNDTLGSFVNVNPDHPSYQPYKIYEGAGKLKNNIIVGLGSRLNLFQNERIANICSKDENREIDLVAPLKEKCAYFVITSDQESSTEVLSSLFFSFLFIDQVNYYDRHKVLPDFKPVKVNYILDEFINCGVIPDMDKKITTVRSRGLALSLIVQNIGQMKDRYRMNWEALISNCDTTLILSVGKNDNTTAKWVSEILGTQTVEAVSNVQTYHKSSVLKMAGQYKETKGIGKRQLLSPDEVTSLVRDREILLFSSHHPLLLEKFDYSNHPMSKEMIVVDDEFDEDMKLEIIDTRSFMKKFSYSSEYGNSNKPSFPLTNNQNNSSNSSNNKKNQTNRDNNNNSKKKSGKEYKKEREKQRQKEEEAIQQSFDDMKEEGISNFAPEVKGQEVFVKKITSFNKDNENKAKEKKEKKISLPDREVIDTELSKETENKNEYDYDYENSTTDINEFDYGQENEEYEEYNDEESEDQFMEDAIAEESTED